MASQEVTWAGRISPDAARDVLAALRNHQAKRQARSSERANDKNLVKG